ncbi:MAG: hypothetical protein ACI4TB_06435, partial [Lachnospiraceae bacterium]
MFGSITGNIAGTLYFLYFQLAGILLMLLLLKKENILTKLLLGSVSGSLLLQWLPILFSFLFDFSYISHILAMLPLLPIFFLAVRCRRRLLQEAGSLREQLTYHRSFLLLLTIFMLFWIYLLYTHVIPLHEDGAIYTGQCTYGDMNLHLSFITSIANQSTFPPDYPIFPGARLSYPFLSDSISSSVYLFGASIRYAYILPMVFAMLQIFSSLYLFAMQLWHSRGKSIVAFLLYFLNGGLGFIYFIDWTKDGTYSFSDIFTNYYTTPTNLVDANIRWVNVIADMFLPQRATLFGYAVLFPCIWLLYRAAFDGKKKYFLLAGIFAGVLPMIHTHSFLGIGLISAAWLLLVLYDSVHPDAKRYPLGKWVLLLFVAGMCLVQYLCKKEIMNSSGLMAIGILFLGLLTLYGIYLLFLHISKNGWRNLLSTWGVYLTCVLLLAVPQLVYWTFGQVAEGSYVHGHFNWSNLGDFYPWFYLKNIGLPLLLILCAACACSKKNRPFLFAAFVIWVLTELIAFTPNTYDNNKLLYIAYLLLILAATDYGVELYRRLRGFAGIRLLAGLFLFFSVFSGILT